MIQETNQRDYLFDNYKALLILIIVIGHFIEESYEDNIFIFYIKLGIYAFHVPAFVFVSGYFSKKNYSVHDLIGKLIFPYFIYEVLYYLFYTFVLHVETKLYLIYPKFSLWYLLCLFFWRLAAAKIKKSIPAFVITVIAGLLIGFSPMKDNFLSLPRMIVFFPFFLAGKWMTKEHLEVLRRKRNRIICAAAIGLTFGCLFLISYLTGLSPKIFYGRYNYEFLEQGAMGVLSRLAAYLVGFILTFGFIGVLTNCKRKWSYIGKRTMAIYIIHGFIYNFFKERTSLIDNIEAPLATVLLLVACTGLTLLLSLPVFTTVTSFVSGIYGRITVRVSLLITKARKKT